MPKIELKVPRRMLAKLDKIAKVDDLTRSEVVRTAIREYFNDLDWRSIERELEEMEEELAEIDEEYDDEGNGEEEAEEDEEEDAGCEGGAEEE